MMPIRKGDGTGLSVPGFSEVRTGDGTLLWSSGADIPDSELTQIADHIWYMNEGSGQTLEDTVGTADASTNFSDWRTGAGTEDTYLKWDATDDIADAGQIFDSQTALTISHWCYFANNTDTAKYTFDQGTGNGENFFGSKNYNSDQSQHYYSVQIGGNSNGVDNDIGGRLGQWNLVTVTYGSGTARTYMDDTEVSSFSTNDPTFSADPFVWGNRADNARTYDDGIDYMVISFQEATSTEISDHFQKTKSLYGR